MSIIAPNTQSWWDAVCNFNPNLQGNIAHPSVLSDKQYGFYRKLRNNNNHEPSTLSMSEEEQFMYVCFMAAFHNEI